MLEAPGLPRRERVENRLGSGLYRDRHRYPLVSRGSSLSANAVPPRTILSGRFYFGRLGGGGSFGRSPPFRLLVT